MHTMIHSALSIERECRAAGLATDHCTRLSTSQILPWRSPRKVPLTPTPAAPRDTGTRRRRARRNRGPAGLCRIAGALACTGWQRRQNERMHLQFARLSHDSTTGVAEQTPKTCVCAERPSVARTAAARSCLSLAVGNRTVRFGICPLRVPLDRGPSRESTWACRWRLPRSDTAGAARHRRKKRGGRAASRRGEKQRSAG